MNGGNLPAAAGQFKANADCALKNWKTVDAPKLVT
jgi:hypothetical protein